MRGGIFNFLEKNEIHGLEHEKGLGHIKDELKKQDTWIKYLHNYSKDIHKYASYINDSNTKHKKEILSELNKLHDWIAYLHESNSSLKQEVALLKSDLKKTIRNDFEIYHRVIEQYLKLKFDEEKIKKEELKALVLAELKSSLPVNNGNNAKPVTPITHYNTETDLSNPEKTLLNLLFNEGKPLTYEAMAAKLNKSVNSVRVYMNSLRAKRPIIEEFSAPGGSKVFSIKNSELVKTLFNI